MTLRPADPGTGVRFLRTDVPGSDPIPARFDTVSDTTLCTTIGQDGCKVATIEHLMAAFAGCGVDNVLVELDGPEVPVMDGSSAPFVFLIECADLVEQDAAKRWIKVLKPVKVGGTDKSASLVPSEGFSVSFSIDFDNEVVAKQSYFLDMQDGVFKAEVARARTFGFISEVDKLRQLGLARGGSLDNVVIVDNNKILNEDGLRYGNEFVRHKILDSIGDLYLSGAPIIGHFTGERSGHAMNNALLCALFEDETAWCYSEHGPDQFAGEPAMATAATA